MDYAKQWNVLRKIGIPGETYIQDTMKHEKTDWLQIREGMRLVFIYSNYMLNIY